MPTTTTTSAKPAETGKTKAKQPTDGVRGSESLWPAFLRLWAFAFFFSMKALLREGESSHALSACRNRELGNKRGTNNTQHEIESD